MFDSISKLKDYEQWQEVIKRLLKAKQDLNIVLLGNSTEISFEDDRVINLVGKTSIDELKSIINNMDALVGVDGLNTNISMALGIKTIVLFCDISKSFSFYVSNL